VRLAQAMVAGVDGCRAGWVVAAVPVDGRGPSTVRIVPDLGAVVAALEAGQLLHVTVDIPIGLPARDPRAADVLARAQLGPRRSSVFPAPARAVLGATDYADACARSRAACGKALSKQLFNILPKIAEADGAVTPVLQTRLAEMCPELSFAVLTGAPMTHAKSTPEGLRQRRVALETVFADAAVHADRPPRGARADDVLDALVGAWTARRFAAGDHIAFGGDRDETGLRMEVLA
jgi:predicted RNase H-like nuclease